MKDIYTLHTDGACWPNPNGRATYGYVLTLNYKKIKEGNGLIGEERGMTNNSAEYHAVWQGLLGFLDVIKEKSPAVLNIYSDSQLVVNMINKRSKGNREKYYFKDYQITLNILSAIRQKGHDVYFCWIPREQNQEADALSQIGQPARASRDIAKYKKNKKKAAKLKEMNILQKKLDKDFRFVL